MTTLVKGLGVTALRWYLEIFCVRSGSSGLRSSGLIGRLCGGSSEIRLPVGVVVVVVVLEDDFET